jgi:hypothetical protein
MAKNRRRSGKPEMLWRSIEISSFSARVSLDAVHHKGQEPFIEAQPWLELRGTATEPVRDVRDVKISMFLRDRPQVGSARQLEQLEPSFKRNRTWILSCLGCRSTSIGSGRLPLAAG